MLALSFGRMATYSSSYFLFTLLLVHAFAILAPCNASNLTLPRFPAILIFGDSTVDTGNNNYQLLSLFKGNHNPYGIDFPGQVSTGRFSNGKLVVDFLASELNIKDVVPAYLDPNLSENDLRTGVCFASGGSGYDNLTNLGQVIPFSTQIEHFKDYLTRFNAAVGDEEEAKTIINNALVVISAGTNDLAFNFYDIPTRRLQGYTIDGYQNFLQNNLRNFLKALYDLGCRKFAIAGLPPVGCIPVEMAVRLSTTCLADQNADAQVYNTKLEKLVSQMENSLTGSRIIYADIYTPFMDMINNPQKYGFTVTNRGCCGLAGLETGPLCNILAPPCADRSKYLFWDSVHPGESAYRHLTQHMLLQLAAKYYPPNPPAEAPGSAPQ